MCTKLRRRVGEGGRRRWEAGAGLTGAGGAVTGSDWADVAQAALLQPARGVRIRGAQARMATRSEKRERQEAGEGGRRERSSSVDR